MSDKRKPKAGKNKKGAETRKKTKSAPKTKSISDGTQSQPNIIVIWADNMGWADLSSYGCPYYKTPHLDGLAKRGTRFVNAYASAPMCTPSRVGFLTGRYPGRCRIGVQETLGLPSVVGDKIGLPEDHPTVPSLLQEAGYDTALVGKWHCGHLPTYSPLKSGFEEYFGHKTGSIDYFRHVDGSGAPDLWEGDELIKTDGYATKLFSERAVEFVKRPRSKPFFLTLWYNAPHWPWEGPDDKYLSDEIAGYDSHRTWIETGTSDNYAEVVKSMDAGIGSVLKALEEKGLDKNTLVIFSSDQGGDEMAYFGPYRRGRLHEGGIKVPLIMSWPGVVLRNHVSEQVNIHFDISATILSMAGTKPDPNYPTDGDDLSKVFQDKKKEYPRKLFWRHSGNPRPGIPFQKAMRDGKWKYLKVGKQEFLYDLSKDINEANDLKERYPKKFAAYRKEYRKWESKMLPYDKEQKDFKRVVFK